MRSDLHFSCVFQGVKVSGTSGQKIRAQTNDSEKTQLMLIVYSNCKSLWGMTEREMEIILE